MSLNTVLLTTLTFSLCSMCSIYDASLLEAVLSCFGGQRSLRKPSETMDASRRRRESRKFENEGSKLRSRPQGA